MTILTATNINAKYVKKITYRPFDYRFVYYTKNKGFISFPRYDTMKPFVEIKDNAGLIITKLLAMDILIRYIQIFRMLYILYCIYG